MSERLRAGAWTPPSTRRPWRSSFGAPTKPPRASRGRRGAEAPPADSQLARTSHERKETAESVAGLRGLVTAVHEASKPQNWSMSKPIGGMHFA
eukprot:5551202-Pleurochrysis_carterae.AAC.4